MDPGRAVLQRTLKSSVHASGLGLHGGVKVNLVLRPAPENSGIVFHRVDLNPVVSVRADALMIGDTRMCSCLEFEGVKVGTIEHLMSALAGLGIDNCHIDIDAPEVPILDGSAAPFIFLIQSVGTEEQKALRRYIRITSPIEVREADRGGDKWARFTPYNGMRFSFGITFHHPAIERSAQTFSFDFSGHNYAREVARARTFGFMQDVEWLRENGLALGGGLDNAIVLDEFRVLNPDGLRYPDEFVRHKVLDAVGDLYLLGHPVIGEFTAHKSGHALNNILARRLLEATDCWEWVTFDRHDALPPGLQTLPSSAGDLPIFSPSLAW